MFDLLLSAGVWGVGIVITLLIVVVVFRRWVIPVYRTRGLDNSYKALGRRIVRRSRRGLISSGLCWRSRRLFGGGEVERTPRVVRVVNSSGKSSGVRVVVGGVNGGLLGKFNEGYRLEFLANYWGLPGDGVVRFEPRDAEFPGCVVLSLDIPVSPDLRSAVVSGGW